jgi:hypothetical protein
MGELQMIQVLLKTIALPLVGLSILFATSTGVQAADTVDPKLYQTLKYRSIGPFRGGRVTAVAGIEEQPLVYYMGATGGGVWKTTSAGATWENVSDGFFNTTGIGAIDVADSDPNIVYVGTGEGPVRGVKTSHGDGVYKSTDAGKTWTLGANPLRQRGFGFRRHDDGCKRSECPDGDELGLPAEAMGRQERGSRQSRLQDYRWRR